MTISKIRFLEDQGLIKPERTAVRLPQVLRRRRRRGCATSCRMQRDHYLPLKVIGDHLDAIDRGLEPPRDRRRRADGAQGRPGADGLPTPESFRADQRRSASRAAS